MLRNKLLTAVLSLSFVALSLPAAAISVGVSSGVGYGTRGVGISPNVGVSVGTGGVNVNPGVGVNVGRVGAYSNYGRWSSSSYPHSYNNVYSNSYNHSYPYSYGQYGKYSKYYDGRHYYYNGKRYKKWDSSWGQYNTYEGCHKKGTCYNRHHNHVEYVEGVDGNTGRIKISPQPTPSY